MMPRRRRCENASRRCAEGWDRTVTSSGFSESRTESSIGSAGHRAAIVAISFSMQQIAAPPLDARTAPPTESSILLGR